jgi:hypothetical protein
VEITQDASPLPVYSVIHRAMQFIERQLPDSPFHGNERLHFSNVVGLLLSAAMHPTVRSLRAIEQHSHLPQTREMTRLKVVPRSTMSDALARFDPEQLRPVIRALQARLPWLRRLDPQADRAARQIVAMDGSWFTLAGEVTHALQMNRGNQGRQSRVRLNLQLDVESFLPLDCDVSGAGDGSEPTAFMRRLVKDCIYLVDRNFVHFGFINAVHAAGSNLVLRLRKDTNFAASAQRPLTPRDREAKVLQDEVGMLCGPTSPTNQGRASRTGKPPAQIYRRIVIWDEKNKKPVILLTDLLDVPAWVIGELYRLRWQIELFLRWLKVFANFEHLISQSPRGMTMQFYVAVLLTLLLHIRTGMPVGKHTLHILQMSATGQLDEAGVQFLLARRERERLLELARRARKKQV